MKFLCFKYFCYKMSCGVAIAKFYAAHKFFGENIFSPYSLLNMKVRVLLCGVCDDNKYVNTEIGHL